MIELAFVVCLRFQPVICEERVLPPFLDASELQCVIGAQPVLAQWSRQHPDYHVTRWTCRALRADRAI